jgi:hypothetical protein
MGKVKEYYDDEIRESDERLRLMEEYRYWSEIEQYKNKESLANDYMDYFKIPNFNKVDESD